MHARSPRTRTLATLATLARARTPVLARRQPVWTPPLPRGALPAYDEAVKYIRADARALQLELRQLKAAPAPAAPDAVARRHVLAVQSEVNLPEVRAAFRSGRYPFARPVFRHLAEQRWRSGGALDLLMERLHQMHVLPDVLPALHPTVDVRVHFPAPAPRRGLAPVLPGAFLPPAQTLAPPRIAATAFHTDTRLYTLLLLDPDVPADAAASFQTFLHWMQPNIALSGARRTAHIAPPRALVPYVPPHPQRGTPYHRYVLLLLPQRARLPADADAAPARGGFDVRGFCARWGLDPAQGGGAHMWRAVWDGAVGGVYRDTLGLPEPRYGRPPAPARYDA